MKKITFLILSLFLSGLTWQVEAQCLTGSEFGAMTPSCATGALATVAGSWTGEYSIVNVTTGNQYEFTSTDATHYLTVSNSAGNTPFAFGATPLTWTSTVTGQVRFYTHLSAACNSNTTSHNRSVRCVLPPPANNLCANATQITGNGTYAGTTIASTNSPAPACVVTNTSGNVWYRFTDVSGTGLNISANTCSATGFDTKLSVYSGSCGALVCVTGNDDAACALGSFRSEVNFTTNGSSTYYIMVHGFGTSTGNFELNVSGFMIGSAPQIVCPNDIVINNTTGTCGAQVFFNNATAFDAEDGLIPVTQTMGPGTGSIFPIGDTIIEFSATDSDGNTSTCQFTITVQDVDDPTAVCQNITVELDGSGSVTINAADLDGGSSDLCGAVTFSFDMAGTVTTMMLDCSDLGENTITLYVTDEGGNVVSCESTVTVEDNIAPVIVCANAGGLNAISEDFNAGVPAGWSSVINTGNCAWEAGNLPYTGWSFPTPAMFFDDDACGPGAPASNATLFSDVYDTTGATSLDISFDLAYRHLGTSSFTVEAFDGAIWQPVATYNTNQQIVSAGPFDLLAYSNANFQVRFIYNDGSGWNWGVAVDNFLLEYETPAAAIPQYVLDINGEVTVDINDLYTSASDNCSVTVSAGGASGGTQELLNLGFAAGNGNFGTMFDVVALGDVTIDSFDVNAQTGAVLDIVVYYKDGTHAGFETNAAAWTLIGEAPGTVSAGVGIPTELNLDLAQGILAGETGAFYVTATNISGSNGFQYTNGTGVGNVWAEDANIQMLEGKAQTLLFGGSLFQPRVFNGNIHYSTGGGSGSGLTFTCDDLGIVNVVVTATDSSGNTTTCTTQIEIIDNMAPVIVGEDITVELGADGTVCIEPEDLFGMIPPEFNVITISSDNGSGSVGTTDLVVNVTTSVSVSFDWSYTTADGPGFDSFGYIINGVYTQLTDPTGPLNQTGNATVPLTAGQIFGFRSRSEDGTFGPSTTTVSNFQPGFVGQFAPANWTEVLTNSDGSAVFVEINPGSSSAFDNCGITVTAIDISCFTCADIGTPVTVTIFASDASGNIASTTAVVTVVDLLGPVIGCLDDMTVDTDPDSITYTLPDYIGEGLVSVTDNCTDPVTIFSQSPAPGTLLLDGTYTITFTAEDEYGNESSCSFELTVETILGIDENQLSDAIVMYPNPASAFVNLRNNSTIALTDASIYDITGKLVSKFDLSQMSGEQRLDVSNLASGVYMVYINSETASVVKRLIKK